jgi:hypothetical protein
VLGNVSRSKFTRTAAATAGLTLAFLAACDKETTAPTMVATSNPSLKVGAAIVPAIAGETFSFPGGAGALSPTLAGRDLTVTFGGSSTAPTATIVIGGAGGGTSTVPVTFGSCTFQLFGPFPPAGSYTVDPCQVDVFASGVGVGTDALRNAILRLGAFPSLPASVNVRISPDGGIVMNGVLVGTVSLGPATGGGS